MNQPFQNQSKGIRSKDGIPFFCLIKQELLL